MKIIYLRVGYLPNLFFFPSHSTNLIKVLLTFIFDEKRAWKSTFERKERERERERGGYVVEEVNKQKEKYCSRIQHFYLYKLKA